jgi:hypothetical protein
MNWLYHRPACFETRPEGALLSMRGASIALGNAVILRRPRSGRLEGRTAPIQPMGAEAA